MKIGIDVSGPIINYIDKGIMNNEGFVAVDLNEKYSAVLSGGYLNYKYSQYNYEYKAHGVYFRTGVDINLLKPNKSQGKYWAGVGLRYGLSLYKSQVPSFSNENYWGRITKSLPERSGTGHFLEISPGFRADVLKNLSIGWSINIRKMISSGSGGGIRPVYMPGYGNVGNTFGTGVNYFIIWNIPYKKKQIIIRKEEPEDTGDEENQENQQDNDNYNRDDDQFRDNMQDPGYMQPSPGSREYNDRMMY